MPLYSTGMSHPPNGIRRAPIRLWTLKRAVFLISDKNPPVSNLSGLKHNEPGMYTAMSTIPGLMLEATDRIHKANAFQFKQNGQWVNVATEDFLLRVEELFHGLRALGIQAGDRV